MPQTVDTFENAGRLKGFSVVPDGTKAAWYQILYFGSNGSLIHNINNIIYIFVMLVVYILRKNYL